MGTMEKGFANGTSPLPHTPSRGGVLLRLIRTIVLVLLTLILLGFTVWTVLLYTNKLLGLQERVQWLEDQHDSGEANIERYIDAKIDKLLEQVSIFYFFQVNFGCCMFLFAKFLIEVFRC